MSSGIAQLGCLFQSLFAHERHVDRHPQCHERLIATDVRRGLLPTDVLFACLQGEHKGTLSAVVHSLSNDASRHLADEFLGAAHIAHVWTAELHGNAQRLSVAHGNISPPLCRCLQHGQVGCDAVHDEQCFLLMNTVGKAGIVFHDTKIVGLLQNVRRSSPPLKSSGRWSR